MRYGRQTRNRTTIIMVLGNKIDTTYITSTLTTYIQLNDPGHLTFILLKFSMTRPMNRLIKKKEPTTMKRTKNTLHPSW